MKKILPAIVTSVILSACSTTPEVDRQELVRNGNYLMAEQAIHDSLEAEGRNRLLHHLELGLLYHLQGKYQQSNQYFNIAEQISEELYTTSLTEVVSESLTGASFSTYKGYDFESTFVGYYKTLNYLKLAEENEGFDENKLDQALVEVRRLGNRLTVLTNETEGYQEQNEDEDDPGIGVLNFLKEALGQTADTTALEYKDDAFAHYLSAMLYEMGDEYDSARIEYQKAATAYDNGYAAQYKLGDKSTSQVWLDTARMMKRAGGYESELAVLTNKHLSKDQIVELNTVDANSSDLIVIQHTGFAPKKKQLNMTLTADSYSKSLVIMPIPSGTLREQQEQLNWFKMLYADTGIVDIIQNYASGNLGTVALGTVTKRIPLGPLWERAEELGLIAALDIPSRISVSYYPTIEKKFVRSELYIDGVYVKDLHQASSISRIALQEQLIVANNEIQLALAREIGKAIIAQKASEAVSSGGNSLAGSIVGIGLKILNAATASADTRSWTSLPGGVKFSRVTVKAGEHDLTLKTTLNSGVVVEQKQKVTTHNGRPKLWQTRTLSKAEVAGAEAI